VYDNPIWFGITEILQWRMFKLCDFFIPVYLLLFSCLFSLLLSLT